MIRENETIRHSLMVSSPFKNNRDDEKVQKDFKGQNPDHDRCRAGKRLGIVHDRVTNGLALCPNIHRAFDRGLIAIGDDYSVLLSSHIREKSERAYSLNRFEGQNMLLPEHQSAWPDVELLRWHRKEVFRG